MSLTAQRKALRKAFTKTYNDLKVEVGKEDAADKELVEKTFKCLQGRREKLEDLDGQIEIELRGNGATTDAAFEKEYEGVLKYADEFASLEIDVTKVLRVKEDADAANGGDKTKYRLPKLEWKQFGGNPKDWLGFWSQFQSVHDDKSISPQEKFQFLIQATAEKSDAREVVESFPGTAENYPKVISYLKERFGKDDMLVEVYVRDLLRLVLNRGKNTSVSQLYDKLETQLRGLETLGVTSDKYVAMLFPLVESCLSEETLRAWERNRSADKTAIGDDRLKNLMAFLRTEVESETRISLARSGFGVDGKPHRQKDRRQEMEAVPTANDLFSGASGDRIGCVFCGKTNHKTSNCFQAKKMSLTEKSVRLREKRACLKCLKIGHFQRNCTAQPSCGICAQNHFATMCPSAFQEQQHGEGSNGMQRGGGGGVTRAVGTGTSLSTHSSTGVFLLTLEVKLKSENAERNVRVLIDTGSTYSYISRRAVEVLGFTSEESMRLSHCLFGGFQTKETVHRVFSVKLAGLRENFETSIRVLEQDKICGAVASVCDGPWLEQLKSKNIHLTDVGQDGRDIHLLLGADVIGSLLTGEMFKTASGPVAMKTKLGWTVMGRCEAEETCSAALAVTSLHVNSLDVQDLWKLDLIGITDAVETISKEDLMNSALQHFEETVRINDEGRYEVHLPWIEGHPPVSCNRIAAERIAKSSYRKLEEKGAVDKYNKVFAEWEALGVVERVKAEESVVEVVSYLPHHPVFKPTSTTTPIRPVFNASARSAGQPSLNDCLEKGPNLIELIPDVLMRFRNKRYGIIADIKKAFLMICVRKEDRDVLRFFKMENGQLLEYRHCRVVFGVTSSPFLLAATINHHLKSCGLEKNSVLAELKKSFYVDNVATSLDTAEELQKFKTVSTNVMEKARMELCGWIWSKSAVLMEPSNDENVVQLLGLLWDTERDQLGFDWKSGFLSVFEGEADSPEENSGVDLLTGSGCGLEFSRRKEERVTKRTILSGAHRVFDPLGVVCAVTLVPKLLLQDLWRVKLKWDDEVPEETKKKFLVWFRSLQKLQEVKIPRWTGTGLGGKKTLHVFTDASKYAYSACVFLRHDVDGIVGVQLVMAKARVAPTKSMTIPRLELLGCCIGARLAEKVMNVLAEPMEIFYWTDSSNALYWIQRGDNWATFVWNRVQEIRRISKVGAWRHIAGILNPADLPSRGCSATQLLECRWWEGPSWLRLPQDEWPQSQVQCNMKEVMEERKKSVVTQVSVTREPRWYLKQSSSYKKIIRMVAWMLRVKNKIRGPELLYKEVVESEVAVLKMVQREVYHKTHPTVLQLHAFLDENGLWRVKSRIVMREDNEDFRFPILLPPDHPMTILLVRHIHETRSHCGNRTLQSLLRERFWIPQSRRLVRHVIHRCGQCRSHVARKAEAEEAPLPMNRVKDTAVFEVTGVDLGGPLYLKSKEKVWFVLYTCAVYRAVHLELVLSLSTEGFMQTLRRFVARRGRPSVIYSDHGTNFEGFDNAVNKLDWTVIQEESAVHQIKWIFNPPSAPWWGGFWERIVGLVKTLLRRVLGKASLDFEELSTVLCDVEEVVNSRPLTYLSENPEDCVPLTPMLFLGDIKGNSVPDLDLIDQKSLNKRLRYRQHLRGDLRRRFRDEYLALLVHKGKSKTTKISVDDIVLVGDDNKKRINWKLARVLELFPGRDGVERVARVKTATTEILRPIQRLYPLEMGGAEDPVGISTEMEEITAGSEEIGERRTQSGRVVKLPLRFMH